MNTVLPLRSNDRANHATIEREALIAEAKKCIPINTDLGEIFFDDKILTEYHRQTARTQTKFRILRVGDGGLHAYEDQGTIKMGHLVVEVVCFYRGGYCLTDASGTAHEIAPSEFMTAQTRMVATITRYRRSVDKRQWVEFFDWVSQQVNKVATFVRRRK